MYCSNCGKELEDDALFCQECGQEVKTTINMKSENRLLKKKSYFIVGIAIGILVVMGIIICLAIQNSKMKDDSTKKEVSNQTAESNQIDLSDASDTKHSETDRMPEEEETAEDEYIFAHSDTEYLMEEQVAVLTEEELGIARNEILARCGRIYNDEKYKAYFESKSWYKGTKTPNEFDYDKELNSIEKANVNLIKKYEKILTNKKMINEYYEPVLKDYQQAEANNYAGDGNEYGYVCENLFFPDVEETLYYSLIDLNDDNIPELILASPFAGNEKIGEEYNIWDIYSYSEGAPLRLVEGDDAIGMRSFYHICKNKMIKSESSGGATEYVTIYEEVGLDEDGRVTMYLMDGVYSDTGVYYAVSSGALDGWEITEDEYEEVLDKYPIKTDIDWYKLSELKMD